MRVRNAQASAGLIYSVASEPAEFAPTTWMSGPGMSDTICGPALSGLDQVVGRGQDRRVGAALHARCPPAGPGAVADKRPAITMTLFARPAPGGAGKLWSMDVRSLGGGA
jgi:hypothetical protein